MPSHPDRVRRNYACTGKPSEVSIHYAPCDRYTDHVYVDGVCFMCHRRQEIEPRIRVMLADGIDDPGASS